MNQVAQHLNEASVLLEETPHPELVLALRIGAEEIQRLQALVDKGIEQVWTGRRFYFKTLKKPADTALACVFNEVLAALGQQPGSPQNKAMYERFYPSASAETADACECCTPERKCPDHGPALTSNDD